MQSQQGRGQKYDEKAKRKQERHRAQERAHRVGKRAVQHCCQWGCKEKNHSHAKQAEANEKTGHAEKGAAVLLTQAVGSKLGKSTWLTDAGTMEEAITNLKARL